MQRTFPQTGDRLPLTFMVLTYKPVEGGLYYPLGNIETISCDHEVQGYCGLNMNGISINVPPLVQSPIYLSTLGNSGGTGYSVGDYGTVNGGLILATYQVTSVSSGVVTGFNIINVGQGYVIQNNVPTTVTSGSGDGTFTIDITSVPFLAQYIIKPGSILQPYQYVGGGFYNCIIVKDRQTNKTFYCDVNDYAVKLVNCNPAVYATSCGDPTLYNPALGTTTATIAWNAISGAVGYEYINNTSGTTPVIDGTFTETTSIAITGLTTATAYHFWVRSICAGGVRGNWISFAYTTN